MDHVPSHSSGPKWYHLGTLPEITEANVSSKEEVKGKRRTKWFVGYSKPGREKPTDTCLRYPWCGTYVKFQVHPPHFSAGHTFTCLKDKAQAHQAEQDDENQIGDEKRAAAVLPQFGRKAPHIGHAHSRTHRREDESPAGGEPGGCFIG